MEERGGRQRCRDDGRRSFPLGLLRLKPNKLRFGFHLLALMLLLKEAELVPFLLFQFHGYIGGKCLTPVQVSLSAPLCASNSRFYQRSLASHLCGTPASLHSSGSNCGVQNLVSSS